MRILGFIVLVISLSGCLKTRSDMKTIERSRQMQDELQTMQKDYADKGAQVGEIQEQLREMNGRIEVLENKIELMTKDKESSNRVAQDQVEVLQRKLDLLQETIEKMESNPPQQSRVSEPEPVKKGPYEEGESYFEDKDWKKAIVAYTRFREANPKSKNYNKATLKIAVCFEQLGMKDEAKTFYEEVVAKEPKSDEAKKAKARLKALK